MNPRIKDLNKALPINELYTCVQGEGSLAGFPTVAIRTTGCTHRCHFGEGGWCDSWHSSIHPEKGKFSFQDIINIYEDNPQIKHMMLTGGSPTMHHALVNELTHLCRTMDITMTIETEGSHFIKTDYPIDLLSISPKFSNSVPEIGVKTPMGKVVDEKMVIQHNKYRMNILDIRRMIDYHRDYHIKPVLNPVKDSDSLRQLEYLIKQLDIPKNKVYIMPPGDNREELEKVYGEIMNFCRDNGYNFTGRPHIIAFDKERYV